jgi:hypothetical protein
METKNVRILVAPKFYEQAITASDTRVNRAVTTAVRMVRGTLSIGGGGSVMGSGIWVLPRRIEATDGATLLITDRPFFRSEREFDEAIEAALPLPCV